MAYPQSGSPDFPASGPAPTKKVGLGGCLISVALVVVAGIAFVGLLAWATIGVVNDLQTAPGVPVGETGTVDITTTGDQFVFLGNFESGGTIPSVDPVVTITDPSGTEVPVRSSSASSGSSGSGVFRSIGEFTVTTPGQYTITSTSTAPADPGAEIYATNIDISSLGVKILIAFVVGGLIFLAAIIVLVVWLVRRSKAKSAAGPAAYR